jgi:ABC-2 type transport system ATP-binding protein
LAVQFAVQGYNGIMAEAAIDIEGLSKKYPRADKYAVEDISLRVNQGEVYGFLGPNGAGKSTTIRLMMNFIQPTSGRISILGNDAVSASVVIKQSVGYLSGDLPMYRKMTGEQFLNYMEELQPAVSRAYRKTLSNRLQAELHKPLGDLSRGNKQKIGIIQAFMHQPKILILDEPTSGLDPLMQEVFYELIAEAKAWGATVFTSSHILGEVQKMCDRVGIIREGKIVAERNIADMEVEAAQTFDIVFKDRPPVAALKKIKGLQVTTVQDNAVSVHVHGELAPLFAVLAKHQVTKLDARTLDLEEVFLRFYEDKGGKR